MSHELTDEALVKWSKLIQEEYEKKMAISGMRYGTATSAWSTPEPEKNTDEKELEERLEEYVQEFKDRGLTKGHLRFLAKKLIEDYRMVDTRPKPEEPPMYDPEDMYVKTTPGSGTAAKMFRTITKVEKEYDATKDEYITHTWFSDGSVRHQPIPRSGNPEYHAGSTTGETSSMTTSGGRKWWPW